MTLVLGQNGGEMLSEQRPVGTERPLLSRSPVPVGDQGTLPGNMKLHSLKQPDLMSGGGQI